MACLHTRHKTEMVDKANGWVVCADCFQPLYKIVPRWVINLFSKK